MSSFSELNNTFLYSLFFLKAKDGNEQNFFKMLSEHPFSKDKNTVLFMEAMVHHGCRTTDKSRPFIIPELNF